MVGSGAGMDTFVAAYTPYPVICNKNSGFAFSSLGFLGAVGCVSKWKGAAGLAV